MRTIYDYEDVYNEIINSMSLYFDYNNIQTLVLGLSGGLDSTVVAALANGCKRKYPKLNLKLIGVSLPSKTNAEDETNGANLCKCFCDEFYEISIQKDFEQLKKTASVISEQTPLADGNIKARIRMTHLYNIAGIRKGIVLDTDNLTEHYLGFFTIHGDVADYNPIGDLWKHEVYELAEWMINYSYMHYNQNMIDALYAAIDITPTDGNGVTTGGDMVQIAPGCNYNQVDQILYDYLNRECGVEYYINNCKDLIPEGVSEENVRKIIERYKRTHFKRKQLPIKVNLPSHLWDKDYYK